MVYARPKTVMHPSTDQVQRGVTSLLRPMPLPLLQTASMVSGEVLHGAVSYKGTMIRNTPQSQSVVHAS